MTVNRWLIFVLFPFFLSMGNISPSPEGGNEDGYKIRTVVLDAGHGGKDVGCHGSAAYEKDVTLALVLQLGGYIEKYLPDVKVIYTRKTDVFIPLDERAEIANKNDADIFISIHCNAAASKAAYGTETWVMGMHKSEDNLAVAKRENSVIMMEENYEERFDYDPTSPISHIVFSINQYAHQDQSIYLAKMIQDQFRERAGRHDRGVKQAGFVVLYKTTMPSVLIESGFLSNRNEEKFLKSKYGQEIISSAIFRGFRDYKVRVEKEYADLAEGEKFDPSRLNDHRKKELAESEEKETVDEENVKNDTPEETEKQEEIIEFRVQIFASSSLSDVDAAPFNSLNKVYTDQTKSGIFRYFYGSFYDYEEAKKALKKAKAAGFDDAFLTAFKNGTRVDMPESIAISE